MRVKDITRYLESLAPKGYQESYDNSGLIVGDPNAECNKALICLDSIESVIDEAIEKQCQLVIAHHPIVFSGLKKINGKNYVERVVMKAIKNDIAIYAIHTNLDNVSIGVNKKFADRLGLQNQRILAPKKGLLMKLYTFCPKAQADEVRQALFAAGAGHIGAYDQCSFNTEGQGTFRAGEDSNPFAGKKGELHREEEVKIEVLFSTDKQYSVIAALQKAHPYEEVAYDLLSLDNVHPNVGAGMLGQLSEPITEQAFLNMLCEKMQTDCVRHTKLFDRPISTVALCGGAGSFLLRQAKAAGADIFVTADYKYHEFFDAEDQIIIADIGHFESEQFTLELLQELLREKFSTFAVILTEKNTNPVKYFHR